MTTAMPSSSSTSSTKSAQPAVTASTSRTSYSTINSNNARPADTVNTAAPSPPTVVHYGSRIVRCRIDRGVPIEEIIKQLCAAPQLAVNEPASLFALRDVADNDLITIENINRKLDSKASFNLGPSPTIEAADTVDRLVGGDKQVIKAATFALKSRVRVGHSILTRLLRRLAKTPCVVSRTQEDPFLAEFVKRGGVPALARVIQNASGNTLAYALNAMQSILDLDYGYKNLDVEFLQKVSSALAHYVRNAYTNFPTPIRADRLHHHLANSCQHCTPRPSDTTKINIHPPLQFWLQSGMALPRSGRRLLPGACQPNNT